MKVKKAFGVCSRCMYKRGFTYVDEKWISECCHKPSLTDLWGEYEEEE